MACLCGSERLLAAVGSLSVSQSGVVARYVSNAQNNKADTFVSALLSIGAQEKTRTSTPLRALGPEPSASTNSATWASRLAALCSARREVRIIGDRKLLSSFGLKNFAQPALRTAQRAAVSAPMLHAQIGAGAENNKADACASALLINTGAQEKTRTSTPLRALGPEPSASTNSATWASNIAALQ